MSFQILVEDHILFEDDVILVIDKPAGLMVEPDRNGNPNLLQQIKKYLQQSTGSVNEVYAQHIHRIDRPVSGLVLFAKDKSVLKNLSEQFAQRKVKKFYRAITSNAPNKREGILEHWHRKEKKKAKLYETEIEYSERAQLYYKTTLLSNGKCEWRIELLTGKYHQIRAQLASVGCPIIGDELYGSTEKYFPNTIALQASSLLFYHPISNELLTLEVRNRLI